MRDLIDISICSYADLTQEQYDRISPLVNYIVKAEQDFGKLDGTTCHCNGALYPFFHRNYIKTIAHTDVDVTFINEAYFFGMSNILFDSKRTILTTQDTVIYDIDNMKRSIYTGHDIEQTKQFGSTFILVTALAEETGYFPFPLMGHFERDRYTHFINCGLTIEKDAVIIPRFPVDYDVPTNFLYSFDFNLGIVHNTNALEYPETEDRKLRLLKLMGQETWNRMPRGWKWNYNPKSPRVNYVKEDLQWRPGKGENFDGFKEI